MVQMMSLYESLSLITKLLALIHTASLHVKLNGLQHLQLLRCTPLHM